MPAARTEPATAAPIGQAVYQEKHYAMAVLIVQILKTKIWLFVEIFATMDHMVGAFLTVGRAHLSVECRRKTR